MVFTVVPRVAFDRQQRKLPLGEGRAGEVMLVSWGLVQVFGDVVQWNHHPRLCPQPTPQTF